jgi:hypothetical protein
MTRIITTIIASPPSSPASTPAPANCRAMDRAWPVIPGMRPRITVVMISSLVLEFA